MDLSLQKLYVVRDCIFPIIDRHLDLMNAVKVATTVEGLKKIVRDFVIAERARTELEQRGGK